MRGEQGQSGYWIPGAVSVTFRDMHLGADEVLELMAETGLETIEWSENVHLTENDPDAARDLRNRSRRAGISIAAYGSYYRLGTQADPEKAFCCTLRNAAALEAPVVRIWAGTEGSVNVSDTDFLRLCREAQALAEMAGREEIRLAFEWHKDTLTDTNASAFRLLSEIDHPNIFCLWQPTAALSPSERALGLHELHRIKRFINCHVYSWPGNTRSTLNAAEWQYYLDAAGPLTQPHALLLEFVRDDLPDQFRQDAAILKALIHAQE